MSDVGDAIKKMIDDQKRLSVLETSLKNPKRAIEALDLLIRSSSISDQSRKGYQSLRTSLEAYALELDEKVMK